MTYYRLVPKLETLAHHDQYYKDCKVCGRYSIHDLWAHHDAVPLTTDEEIVMQLDGHWASNDSVI
jgi:hypothetical protein